mmetsp:Transcript_39350/g.78869  ORF Transcript_39350/g.78869 Transcript_39350/m.78869 type:complete len:150 (-) Transcript_39350:3419-3868(-)
MNRFLTRIEKEKIQISSSHIEGVVIKFSKKNSRHVFIVLGFPFLSNFGYRSNVAEIFLPSEYPLQPPKVIFRNKIFHPNVDFFGRPCVDILKDQWSPAFQLRTVVLSLQNFMQHFSLFDPLNHKVKKLFQNEKELILNLCRLLEIIFLT